MTGLRHAGIVVSDMEASLRFYAGHFGFEPTSDVLEQGPALARQLGLADVAVRTVKLKPAAGEARLELLQFIEPATAMRETATLTALGLTHLALTVDDADRIHEGLQAAGAAVISPPVTSADGAVRMFFCADPDGVQLEIVQEVGP